MKSLCCAIVLVLTLMISMPAHAGKITLRNRVEKRNGLGLTYWVYVTHVTFGRQYNNEYWFNVLHGQTKSTDSWAAVIKKIRIETNVKCGSQNVVRELNIPRADQKASRKWVVTVSGTCGATNYELRKE